MVMTKCQMRTKISNILSLPAHRAPVNSVLVLGFEERSIWSLKKGKRKGSEDIVSIFVYEVKGSEATFELAKASLKR